MRIETVQSFSWITLAIGFALFVGWILNIVAFCQCDFKSSYKAEAIRGIGIFVAPVGAVAGWIPIEDGEAAKEEVE